MGVLIVTVEIGFWVRKGRVKGGSDGFEKGDVALILGAVTTLLALLLGFTYSMSEVRFEARRQLVIEQTNAIGTTYLRAKTLPEPRSSEIQELLRQYTALLVEIASKMEDDPEKIRESTNRINQLHNLIWAHAAALARESPNPIISVFLQTLNEMIDLSTKRLAAFRNRVPSSIYLVLFVVSAVTLWLVGYYFGSHRQRTRILTTMLALLVTSVMWLILDLDQPVRGAIRTSTQSLIELNQDLSQTSQGAAKKSH
jgi:antitoxin component HigA of HigAB toxin-antitoxin module